MPDEKIRRIDTFAAAIVRGLMDKPEAMLNYILYEKETGINRLDAIVDRVFEVASKMQDKSEEF